MSRWDITDPDRVHSSELRVPSGALRNETEGRNPSVGRAGTGSDESAATQERAGRAVGATERRPSQRRTKHQDRDQAYSLRDSEMRAMTDIGRFRIVDIQDLARFVYSGDHRHMGHDLENLRKQGLIEEKTFFRAHKPTRKMVTLTERGHRFVTKAGGLPEAQRVYHGFVKPKELDHDADLYKVYQRAVKEICGKGGKPVRVRLDFELKQSINRSKEAAGRLPKDMRERWLAGVAEEHGLKIDGTAIRLPDIQVEYQTAQGRLERENLELLSRNYREEGIRGKAGAGFKIYARAGESSRIRRALHDSGLVREVLSI